MTLTKIRSFIKKTFREYFFWSSRTRRLDFRPVFRSTDPETCGRATGAQFSILSHEFTYNFDSTCNTQDGYILRQYTLGSYDTY